MKRTFTIFAIFAMVFSLCAQDQQVINVTLSGMVKTPVSRMGSYRFLLLEDAIGNQLSIYNGKEDAYGDFDVYGYLSEYNVSVSGTGTWAVVDGVETLTATLQEEENTSITYQVIASLESLKTIELTCNDAHYYKPNALETIFVGYVNGTKLRIIIEDMVNGENADVLGMYGETDILAEKVKVSGLGKYTLSGTFQDAIGNTYTVSMTASQLKKTPVNIVNAHYTELDGNVIVTGAWDNNTNFTITLYGTSTSDHIVYEEAELQAGDISATSTAVTFSATDSEFTLTGEFIHAQETAIYAMTITGTAATTALEQITTNKNVFKTIKDGQLLICIDSVIYSAEGQKL